MQWSPFQTAIFDTMRTGTTDMVAVARAGSGKTTTLIEGLNHLTDPNRLVCAFNKRIQEELSARTSRGTIRTLHAMGLRQYGRGRNVTVDQHKMRPIVTEVIRRKQYRGMVPRDTREFQVVQRVQQLCSIAKNTMATTQQDLARLARSRDLVDHRTKLDLFVHAAATALNRSCETPEVVDFDDMIWFPLVFRDSVTFEQFDVVLVDEAQDLNPTQIELVKQMAGGRTVGFGDPAQAIYLFRGADKHAFHNLTDNATNLPLPISYRCAEAVVQEAQQVVPDIQPAPGAPRGDVQDSVEYPGLLVDAAPGDFVLSRTNAPLISVCLALLRRNKPAVIAGAQLGRALQGFMETSGATTVSELRVWLDAWLLAEQESCMPEYPQQYARAQDRVRCLQLLAQDCRTTREIGAKIRKLFSDDTPESTVTCSTVHKAKGLERDRVWLLAESFGHREPREWHNRTEEANLWYVAVTRARQTLCYVTSPLHLIEGQL